MIKTILIIVAAYSFVGFYKVEKYRYENPDDYINIRLRKDTTKINYHQFDSIISEKINYKIK